MKKVFYLLFILSFSMVTACTIFDESRVTSEHEGENWKVIYVYDGVEEIITLEYIGENEYPDTIHYDINQGRGSSRVDGNRELPNDGIILLKSDTCRFCENKDMEINIEFDDNEKETILLKRE